MKLTDACLADDITERLRSLGHEWPPACDQSNPYASVMRDANMLWIAGQIPERDGVISYVGKLGAEMSVAEGAAAASLCALNVLNQIRLYLGGDLKRLKALLHLKVYVNASDRFEDVSAVADGASKFLNTVLGVRGLHTRSTIGVSSLHAGIPVEIDAVASISEYHTLI